MGKGEEEEVLGFWGFLLYLFQLPNVQNREMSGYIRFRVPLESKMRVPIRLILPLFLQGSRMMTPCTRILRAPHLVKASV
jgi:hypothetical protein